MPKSQLKYIPALDGIRGIAALMIMFFHFFQNLQTQNSSYFLIKKLSIFGQTGVSLFFVLSGFLITRILVNSKRGNNYFKNFYLKRIFRIFPLYYLFLIIFYFLAPFIFNQSITPFKEQLYYWIYLQNFAITFGWKNSGPSQFWSLAVEEHFYLFWPVLVYYLREKWLKVAIYLIIVLSLIIRFYFLKMNIQVFYFTFTNLDQLALGSLLALIEINNKIDPSKIKLFLVLIFIVIVPTILLWNITSGRANMIIQIIKPSLISLIYFFLLGLIICLKELNFFNKILRTKFLVFTGKISYGLYVYHIFCFLLISHFLKDISIPFSFIFSFGLTFIFAYLSFRFYESYFISFKKSLKT